MLENERAGTSEDRQWLDAVMLKIAESIGEKDTRYVLSNIKQYLVSNIYFVRMSYTSSRNEPGEIRLLIKKAKGNHLKINQKCQFHNEIVFYRMFRQPGENFPRYFYGYVSPSESDEYSIVALENMNSYGFKDSPVLFDVPYNYVLTAMRELGRFHAKGYALKKKDPAKFRSIVDRINEIILNRTDDQRRFFCITSTRAVNYLRAQNHDASFCDKMEAVFLNVYEKVLIPIMTVTESSEPLSTICHGDFTVANMLFRPLSDDSFDAMLIDFGMIRYGTPVIDLSTFICLSCTNETIRDKLHDMLAVYQKALINYMSLEGLEDTEKYSYETIYNDYKEGCLYGFFLASFYLACVLGYVNPPEIIGEEIEKLAHKYNRGGGDKVSAMLAEMLLHMVEMGCVERFL